MAIGKPSINNVTQEDILVLIGIAQAIKDGDTTVDNAFRPNKKTESTAMKEADIAPIDIKTTQSFSQKVDSANTGKLDFENE